jgi:hypothetical protein
MKAELIFAETSVTKRFPDALSFRRELEVYRLGLSVVPRLLSFEAPFSITMQRLPGQPYLDVLEESRLPSLAETVSTLHRATLEGGTCLCHYDNQPRNLLHCGDRHYLIDFSASRRGFPESDLTHLLLFWAEVFDPPAFEALCRSFLSHYLDRLHLDPFRWQRCLGASILRFDLRRALYRGPSSPPPSPQAQQNRSLLRSFPMALIKS